MKKIIIFILSVILLDAGWMVMFEHPLFAIKDKSDDVNLKYYGIFYDVVDCFESETHVVFKGSKFACHVRETASAEALMVQVNDVLYIQTGRIMELARCGVMDGMIESSVSEDEVPFQNNQSNFGTGYGYQFTKEGTLDVNIEGQWHLFASEECFDELVLDLTLYQKVSSLPKRNSADVQTLFSFNGHLYAKSNALIDYAGPSTAPLGMLRYVISDEYVPQLHEETNQRELLGALVYDEGDSSIILEVDGIYCLFVKI